MFKTSIILRRLWCRLALMICAVALFATVPGWSQTRVYQSEEMRKADIAGRLKQYIETVNKYTWENGKATVVQKGKKVYDFDAQGRNVRVEWTDAKGQRTVFLYTYDRDNRKIKWVSNQYDRNGKFTEARETQLDGRDNRLQEIVFDASWSVKSTTSWQYDANGHTVAEIGYIGKSIQDFRNTWLYDSQGKLLEETNYDQYGRIVGKRYRSYERNGHEETVSDFDANRKLSYRETTVRDAQERIVERRGYESADRLAWKTATAYGQQGAKVSEEALTFASDGQVARRVFDICDAAGQVVETVVTRGDGSVESTSKKSYNQAGKILESVDHDAAKGETEVWSYRYDEANRLLEKRCADLAGQAIYSKAYQYNAAGKPTRFTETYFKNRTVYQTAYNYDAHGNLLEMTDSGYNLEAGEASGTVYESTIRTYVYTE
jgi:YD repeat-containing protein